MKKIFLTSGIVVCMACPAFGTGTGFPYDTPAAAAAASGTTITNACVEPTLGVYAGSTTLEAIWNPEQYQVIYAGNQPGDDAVTGVPSSSSVYYDASYSVSSATPTVTGYRFNKWIADYNMATGAEASTDYAPEAEIAHYNVAHDTTLTADWTPNPWTITYVQGTPTNGSVSHASSEVSGTVATQNVQYDGTGYTAATNGYSIYGYEFRGWSSDYNTATGVEAATPYDAGDDLGDANGKYKVDNDVVMTAQWAPVSYKIDYNCGSGIGSPATTSAGVYYDDTNFAWANNTDLNNCKKAGHHFTGWTCNVPVAATIDGTAFDIIENGGVTCSNHSCTGNAVSQWTFENIRPNATITCTAQYAVNEIDLTWELDGGTAGATEGGASCTYGGGVTLPAAPTKTGYTFSGWRWKEATPETGIPTDYTVSSGQGE